MNRDYMEIPVKMISNIPKHTTDVAGEIRVFPCTLILLLMMVLVACGSAAATPPATLALTATLPPTQVILPSPTHITAPAIRATNTTPLTQIPPTQTMPTTLPTQILYRPPSQRYLCPWAEQAQTTPVYSFQVVNTYDHDPTAYTQGLIYRDGVLFEGTGLNGQSSLRKVALESGEVAQAVQLPEQYFGEGITELDGKIFQLTWREQTGFVYDAATFEQLQTFFYPTEGWGLTEDDQRLIMSDGSSNLYFLDPETLKTTGQVTVSAENVPVPRLNELEYIEGEVWANVYQTSCIARIDPASGQVLGWIDITGMLAPQDLAGAEVPNGIAYDGEGKRIFVTGKQWPRLFEITVAPVE